VEKFFDRVNRDVLMARVVRSVNIVAYRSIHEPPYAERHVKVVREAGGREAQAARFKRRRATKGPAKKFCL